MLDASTGAEQAAPTEAEQSPFLTEEEAEAQASNLYAAFFADGLRSGVPPRVKNVRLLDPFRSTQDSSGGIYVVNFENNGGYIMMAEHRHGEPILAACPQGNFDPDKALDNPNFAPILANMCSLVASGPQHRTPDGKRLPPDVPMPEPSDPNYPDGPILPPLPDPECLEIRYHNWEVEEDVPALIPVEWGQKEPFYRHLPKIDGKLPVAGCVPTAVAQLLAYHRKPEHLDWGRIISESNRDTLIMKDEYVIDALADLFREIGVLFDVDYGLQESGAFSYKTPRVLDNYGITCNESFEKYSWSKVLSEFKEGRPIYIRGNRTKVTTFENNKEARVGYRNGHAWVIDGCKVFRRKVTKLYKVTTRPNPFSPEVDEVQREEFSHYEYEKLVHCNFGWVDRNHLKLYTKKGYPNKNGYYLDGIFDTNNKIVNPELLPDLRSVKQVIEGKPGFYQYNIEVLTGIQPKK